MVGRAPVAAYRSRSNPDGRPDSSKATFREWHVKTGADTQLESQRINLPSHDSPSATPESEQKFQKKWTKSKKAKEQKDTKRKKFG